MQVSMNPSARKRVSIWLLCGCFLIFAMVVIGGITRLTGSGLSITEWNLIMGAIPPMNDSEWQEAFEKYQQIPQFEIINPHFELHDFKVIFWWEYFHRLLGRLIGIVFIVPFLYFLLTRQLDRKMVYKCLFLFFLGGLQGFLGWFMVKSGLTERTTVSHIRLAIHLTTAFITFAFTWWYALELMQDKKQEESTFSRKKWVLILFALLLVQIVYGAFVAGLHAGKIYNTFPLMNGQLIPTGVMAYSPFWYNLANNAVTVQFIHRIFAFILLFMIFWLWSGSLSEQLNKSQRRAVNLLLVAVCIQFLLGVLTILSKTEIALASLHQIGAFFLFAVTIYLLFHTRSQGVKV